MSGFGSDLHRFGLNPEEPPDQRQWANLCRVIRALANNPMLNIGTENSEVVIPQTPAHAPRAAAAAAAAASGPFCRVFKLDGDWMLTGGTVTGGDTNVTIPDIDLGTIATPPADGTHFWIKVDGDAVVEDDVLLPGFNLSTAVVSSGASVPTANVIPTASAEAGTLYISLGSWSGGVFIPAGCGNIQVNHCPGSLTFSRGTTHTDWDYYY